MVEVLQHRGEHTLHLRAVEQISQCRLGTSMREVQALVTRAALGHPGLARQE